jgi:hypothetical protein
MDKSTPTMIDKYLQEISAPLYTRKGDESILNSTKGLSPTNRLLFGASSGNTFSLFAKNTENVNDNDIWTEIARDKVRTKLTVQSWRDELRSNEWVTTVENITLNLSNAPVRRWLSSHREGCGSDHSKWAVQTTSGGTKDWVCFGDLNRRKSEIKKGGAVCFQHAPNLARNLRESVNRAPRSYENFFEDSADDTCDTNPPE